MRRARLPLPAATLAVLLALLAATPATAQLGGLKKLKEKAQRVMEGADTGKAAAPAAQAPAAQAPAGQAPAPVRSDEEELKAFLLVAAADPEIAREAHGRRTRAFEECMRQQSEADMARLERLSQRLQEIGGSPQSRQQQQAVMDSIKAIGGSAEAMETRLRERCGTAPDDIAFEQAQARRRAEWPKPLEAHGYTEDSYARMCEFVAAYLGMRAAQPTGELPGFTPESLARWDRYREQLLAVFGPVAPPKEEG